MIVIIDIDTAFLLYIDRHYLEQNKTQKSNRYDIIDLKWFSGHGFIGNTYHNLLINILSMHRYFQ